MKKIYYLLLALLVTSLTFTACTEDELIETVSESDFPMILDPVFPDRDENGNLPTVATLNRDQTYELTARVTPSEYVTVKWYIDDVEVLTGLEFSALFKAGTYNLKIVATSTNGMSTSREGLLQIDPLDTDPSTTTVGSERIVAAGSKARLYGNNLNLVKYVVIGGQTSDEVTYVEADGCIEYTVPEGLANGEYRVLLGDEDGMEYGGNKVTISSSSLVTGGATKAYLGEEWVLTGVNLDQIQSLTVGGKTITTFLRQSKTELVLECPDLAAGDYTLTGQTAAGSLEFYTAEGNVTEVTVSISEMTGKTVLWEGHQYISWDLPEGDPGHQFNIIPDLIPLESYQDVLKAGSKLKLSYTLEPTAEYHQLQITYLDWDPRLATVDFTADGVYEFEITQEILDAIPSEGGLIIVGHGYYLDMVSVE